MNENMLPVGTVLRGGTYRIEKQINSGGFGNTYVVRNLTFDEVFAMKEFFMKEINLRDGMEVTVSIPSNKAAFESQRNKFKKEAKRLRKLNNKHIVKVHDLFEENRTVYYVMDLIDGQSLADIVNREGPMDELKAMDIFRQMLDALRVIHGQVPIMLHLDIKPSNIMLDKSGNAFLLDFGSSKQIDIDKNMTFSTFTMTRGYAPPELINHDKDRIGPWTDLYELGATLYHILTGHQLPSASEIAEDGFNAFDFTDDVSEKTRELIFWLMSLSRFKRPKSVAEVFKMLSETVLKKPSIESGIEEDDDETIYDEDDDSDGISDEETTYEDEDEFVEVNEDETVYEEDDEATVYGDDVKEEGDHKKEKSNSDDDIGVGGCTVIIIILLLAGWGFYSLCKFIASYL